MTALDKLKSAIPTDRYNIIFIVFLVNGIGTLLPWNMLINADEVNTMKFASRLYFKLVFFICSTLSTTS